MFTVVPKQNIYIKRKWFRELTNQNFCKERSELSLYLRRIYRDPIKLSEFSTKTTYDD